MSSAAYRRDSSATKNKRVITDSNVPLDDELRGIKLDIPFRNALKFFARLSEAVFHEAFDTIYWALNSRRSREHRTFWVNGPRDYVGINARDPLEEGFAFWELNKTPRPPAKCDLCDRLFSQEKYLYIHVRTGQ
ncbi:hypothetical protein L198_04338 [Cryptococcus wingfieldii CBS 7118]|uniref:C2H2-type domain-containing protein n=1 Tax=Cryptococcus wingfieldii CBS 7118 TaxID=1295528 RepID=A0A1E3J4C1_9TREE|nr:hypothetical protein L198_04338 [Cryptococcus wingfieldii CBS 7118]ODN95720.1 hypothetical protein L198_04338 [Cryptococcus wingfieldii CBS 7118]